MGKLIGFTIWVTAACNMGCKYCYEGQDKFGINMNGRIANQVAKWIIDMMRKKKMQYAIIRFHGGEPTLNIPIIKQIIKTFEHVSKLNFLYYITTNGYSISDEDILYLSEHFSDISISLDGMEKSHDTYRMDQYGRGTFQSVLDTAKRMNAIFPKMWIRMTIRSSECVDFNDNIHFLVSIGFKNIAAAIDLGDEEWSASTIDLLRNQCLKIKKEFKDKKGYRLQIPFGNEVANLCVCDSGLERFDIDPMGRLYPCTYAIEEKELCLGDVFDGINEEVLGRVRSICEEELANCKGCGGYKSCVSVRCKFINKKHTGDYFTAMPLVCEVHRRELQ
ncbi:MAG: radical SAM protein [Muribaculum sp.]|nr:radical SAM protein [Muribaculum sp.]